MRVNKSVFEQYQQSLSELRRIAKSAPYTVEGNKVYLEAYNKCKSLYLKACVEKQSS